MPKQGGIPLDRKTLLSLLKQKGLDPRQYSHLGDEDLTWLLFGKGNLLDELSVGSVAPKSRPKVSMKAGKGGADDLLAWTQSRGGNIPPSLSLAEVLSGQGGPGTPGFPTPAELRMEKPSAAVASPGLRPGVAGGGISTVPKARAVRGTTPSLRPGVAGGGIPMPPAAVKGGKGILGSLGKALGGVGAFASANPLMLLLSLAGAPFMLEGWVDLISKMRGTDPESRAMEAASKDRKLQLLANAIGISSENKRAEKAQTEGVFDRTLGAIGQEAMLDRMGPMGQSMNDPAAMAGNRDRGRAAQLAASFNSLQGGGPDAGSIDPFIREGIF